MYSTSTGQFITGHSLTGHWVSEFEIGDFIRKVLVLDLLGKSRMGLLGNQDYKQTKNAVSTFNNLLSFFKVLVPSISACVT